MAAGWMHEVREFLLLEHGQEGFPKDGKNDGAIEKSHGGRKRPLTEP
jgi:hypothetical protein